MVAILNLLRSRTGRALRAVATNELGADAIGIDSFNTKLLFFVVTAGMAGIAGSLYVHINQYASPETFDISAAILLVVMVALGGSGTYWGPVTSALILTVVPQLLLDYEDAELMLFGLGMLIVLILFPGGLARVPEALMRRFAKALRRPDRCFRTEFRRAGRCNQSSDRSERRRQEYAVQHDRRCYGADRRQHLVCR
jgi:branched-chain amino acid transport system permease protein